MTRPRFSLRLLIVLVTAIALFLGYSQHRRRQIVNACELLTYYDYRVDVPNEWQDRLWQRKPIIDNTFLNQHRVLLSLHLEHRLLEPSPISLLESLGVSITEIENNATFPTARTRYRRPPE